MSYYPYTFETEIVRHNVGYGYTVVFLDPALHDQLPLDEHPRLRMSGEINEYPVSGAWQPSRGRWYLMLNKKLLRDGGFQIGDEVEVRFRVEDQDAVDVPEALRQALAASETATAAWNELTPGKQRGLAYQVASARTEPTRRRRVAAVLDALLAD